MITNNARSERVLETIVLIIAVGALLFTVGMVLSLALQ
tara:strand:- start:105 stop:218 length:114 start_codon:yes stop_codon:yes gene_type:complete